MTTSCVVDAETTAAAIAPKRTAFSDATARNPVPLMVTTVPLLPLAGEKAMIAGGGRNVNAAGSVAVPAGVVTVTSDTPAVDAGVMATSLFGESTVTLAALVAPNATRVRPALRKPVPRIVTIVPPAAGPVAGVTLATVGGVRYA